MEFSKDFFAKSYRPEKKIPCGASMLGLRPRPRTHRSIRSFAPPAPTAMVAWLAEMLARGPPIRRGSARQVGIHTQTPPHHLSAPHLPPPSPTPPRPGNARGSPRRTADSGLARALSASGAPSGRPRCRGTTMRSTPLLPQPRQAAPLSCPANRSGRRCALHPTAAAPTRSTWAARSRRSPGGTPTRARPIPARSCPWPSATAPSWAP